MATPWVTRSWRRPGPHCGTWSVRSTWCWRRGGDSYLLVLLGAGLEVAQSRAEQARDLLTQVTVRGASLDLTASFGVATHDGTETAAALVERVFAAQYRAKGFGRNRVEVADDA